MGTPFLLVEMGGLVVLALGDWDSYNRKDPNLGPSMAYPR